MSKKKSEQKHQARVVAMQALFQWQTNPIELSDLLEQYLIERDLVDNPTFNSAFFTELLEGCITNIQHIDEQLTPLLDRPLQDLTMVELSVLRLAAYELEFMLATPYKVVINEAILLSKGFGADGGHGFINAVLDKLAQQLRGPEAAKS